MYRSFKILLIVLAVFAVAGSAYAFAAANTFTTTPPSKIGDGNVTISGYDVSNVEYTYDTTLTNINSVDFDLDATATNVDIQLATGGTIYACTNTVNHWTCDTTVGGATTVAATNILRVIANDVTDVP